MIRHAPFTTRRLALLLTVGSIGLASLGDDCDGNIVNDPTFRDWCGDSLCAWTLDTGHIHPVPTWIAEDLGVSFDDTPTQISQVTSESAATCILFTSVANVDPSAQMTLLIDFNNDGTIDATQPIGSASWTNVQTEIPAPRIQSTTGCTGAAMPALTGLLLGDECQTDSQCLSGVCSDVNRLNINTCGQCSTTVPCANSPLCEDGLFEFAQCGPDQRIGQPGELCVTNSDCASGVCVGAKVVGTPVAGAPDSGLDAGANEPGVDCRVRETDGGIVLTGQGGNSFPLCAPVTATVQGGVCR
jgi:hypothetical protein